MSNGSRNTGSSRNENSRLVDRTEESSMLGWFFDLDHHAPNDGRFTMGILEKVGPIPVDSTEAWRFISRKAREMADAQWRSEAREKDRRQKRKALKAAEYWSSISYWAENETKRKEAAALELEHEKPEAEVEAKVEVEVEVEKNLQCDHVTEVQVDVVDEESEFRRRKTEVSKYIEEWLRELERTPKIDRPGQGVKSFTSYLETLEPELTNIAMDARHRLYGLLY